MAKKKKRVFGKKEQKKDKGAGVRLLTERVLLEELTSHFDSSDSYVDTVRKDWDEKEALFICKLEDDLSTTVAKSQVFDPRLSTIVIERSCRVMAQNPTGKAYAISKDDLGKNKLMNLILTKYVQPNANAQFNYLMKHRLWDLYSLIYGVFFALVDWRVDDDYIGPDLWLLPIRDCFPQPGAISIKESDWFQVATFVSSFWLEKRPKETWKNIDKVLDWLEDTKGKTRESLSSERRTYVEREKHPQIPGDKTFPSIEIRTEYRRDRWITYAPDFHKSGKGVILRDIPNPHKNNRIPIVAKHCFPLLDSIFGLGEFERGKTLQYAINSLINLYLDGVKMSLFPPIQINIDGVVPSTIKWGPAEKWLVNRPNVDVQETRLSPQGINTFQSTYSFLVSALMNQAGTTDVSTPKQADMTMGRTPEAIKYLTARESARDNWDRFMMETAIEESTGMMINLVAKRQKKSISLRLFKEEIKEIEKYYPDIVELTEESERGRVKISNKLISAKWDFKIDAGSTYKKDPKAEAFNALNLLTFVLANPQILEIMPRQAQMLGKAPQTIDVAELFKRVIISTGIQDWDKILLELPQQEQKPAQKRGGEPPAPSQAQAQTPQFYDPEIANLAQQILGGISNVPSETNR